MVDSVARGKDNMRNYDLIMKMTDEDLAKFLSEFRACEICEYYDKRVDMCCSDFICVKEYAKAIIGDWLNQPAEEER